MGTMAGMARLVQSELCDLCPVSPSVGIFQSLQMGGKHNPLRLPSSFERHWLLLQRGPSICNITADVESRTLQSSSEWELNTEVMAPIFSHLGTCEVDLFATRLNHKLPQYVSWRPEGVLDLLIGIFP